MRPGGARPGLILLGLALAVAGSIGSRAGPPAAEPTAPAAAWLVDVTDRAGIEFVHDNGARGRRYLPETMGSGGCVLDADGDGLMDLFFVQAEPLAGEEPAPGGNRLFRNLGAGRFADVSAAAGGLGGGFGQGAVCTDVDGDGDADIYLTAFGPNHLLRNDGGVFVDVTARAGVGDPAWSSGAVFFDADGDGDLDLYVVNYLQFSLATHRDCVSKQAGETVYCHPDAYPAAADTFYRNRGDGTFVDATREAGLTEASGKGLGAIVLDADRDGRPDIYVTNDSTPNFLWRNLGGGRFAEVGLDWGVSHNDQGRTEAGMGVDAGDVDGDGWDDLIVTNLSLEANALYLGGPGGFRYATRSAGLHGPSLPVLGFGVHLVDLDRDADRDLVVVNGDVIDNIERVHDGLRYRQPSQLFVNDGGGRFRQIEPAATGELAIPRVARGSMLLDADDDGAVDLAVSYSGDRARLYRNQVGGGAWLGVALRGRGPNTAAIGAVVEVRSGDRRQRAMVRAGSSYQTSSDPRLVFGLGDAAVVEELVVTWPDGSQSRLERPAMGRYHRLAQPTGSTP